MGLDPPFHIGLTREQPQIHNTPAFCSHVDDALGHPVAVFELADT